MNLGELSQQYRGATLPRLIQTQIKSMDEPTLMAAIQGTYDRFPEALRPRIDEFTLGYVKNWFGTHIVSADLGDLFDSAVADIRQMASVSGATLDDDRVFDVFNLAVMRMSYFAHTKPEFRKMLGIKKGWFS